MKQLPFSEVGILDGIHNAQPQAGLMEGGNVNPLDVRGHRGLLQNDNCHTFFAPVSEILGCLLRVICKGKAVSHIQVNVGDGDDSPA